MAWEKRGNKYYYYRKIRIGKQVRSRYVGAGVAGYYCDLIDKTEDKPRKTDERLYEYQEIEQKLNELDINVKLATKIILLSSGYHNHKGQWRKSRERKC